MKSVAFILWQRLANEAGRVRMTQIVEERNSLLEKKEEELDRELKGTPMPSTEPKTTRPSAPRAFALKCWNGTTTS